MPKAQRSVSVNKAIAWYERHAERVASQYERLDFNQIHGWLQPLLPVSAGLALDVGAGSGRDAAGLAQQGFEVVAVEPAAALRAIAQRRHPEPRIRWIADQLPGLTATLRLGIAFDLILLSAVWMHIPPEQRRRAFRKLLSLLKPGGLLAMTLRQGPPDAERALYPTTLDEIEQLARAGRVVEPCG